MAEAKIKITPKELTAQSIKDYQVCSLYYDYRYNKDEPMPVHIRELQARRFDNVLHRVVSFFFYKKQSGITPSYNALLNRWERLWFAKGVDADVLMSERHDTVHGNTASYSNIAALGLLQLYEDFVDPSIMPLMIDEKFILPFDNHVRLNGSIDLVIRKHGVHHVYMWSTEKKRPSVATRAMDFAVLKKAYDYRNTADARVVYHLYDLASSNPGDVVVDDISTEALEFWLDQIGTSDLFVPRRGLTAYCKGCPFDFPCSQFVFPSKKKDETV